MRAIHIADGEPLPRLVQLRLVGHQWKITYPDDTGAQIAIYFSAAPHDDSQEALNVRYIKRCGSLAVPVPQIAYQLIRAITHDEPQQGAWLIW